jgi:hypothetical protein
MTGSTQPISSSGSFSSQLIHQDSTSVRSDSEERDKALAVVNRSIAQTKALRSSQKSDTVESSSISTYNSSSSSSLSSSSLPGAAYAKAIAQRTLNREHLRQIQSDISYILVGSFSVYPWAPLISPFMPFYPIPESESQTSASSAFSESSVISSIIEEVESIDFSDSDTEQEITEKETTATSETSQSIERDKTETSGSTTSS